MIKFAVAEDQQTDFDLLNGYIKKYAVENGAAFEITRFTNELNFIEEYKPVYDILFSGL